MGISRSVEKKKFHRETSTLLLTTKGTCIGELYTQMRRRPSEVEYLNHCACAGDDPGIVVDKAVAEESQVVDSLPVREDLDVHGRQDIRVAGHGGLIWGLA